MLARFRIQTELDHEAWECWKKWYRREPCGPLDVLLFMRKIIRFDQPVNIAFGKPGKSRTVSTVFEAIHCLRSEKWPPSTGPFTQLARDTLDWAKIGHATPAQARQAFADAAREAHILLPLKRCTEYTPRALAPSERLAPSIAH